MAVKLQLRRDTTANWESDDPVLAEGEIGVDLTVANAKIGDGSSAWTELPYLTSGVGQTVLTVADRAALEAVAGMEAGWTAFVQDLAATFVFSEDDLSTEITAADPRYIAPDSDATGASGAWVWSGSVYNGEYDAPDGRFARFGDRILGGKGASFGGQWGGSSTLTGIDAISKSLHGWSIRDAGFLYIDNAGSMAIVGNSKSSDWTEYPGNPSARPATIGVSGFGVNDAGSGNGPCYGLYGDGVNLNGNFTTGLEATVAHIHTETSPTPFNMVSGGANSTTQWLASGGGLDLAWAEYERVNSGAAYTAMLSSFRDAGGTVAWANGQEYVKGRSANDGATAYVCRVAHTAPGSGTFADYRTANPTHWAARQSGNWAASTVYNMGDLATDPSTLQVFYCQVDHTAAGATFSAARTANPTYWKPKPGHKNGILVSYDAIKENSPGSNLFPVLTTPIRHMWSSYRINGELAGYIWTTASTNGTPARGLAFTDNGVKIDTGGVELPNTNSTVVTALDYYLEGAPTVGVTFGGNAVGLTYNQRALNETRIGNLIFGNGYVQLSAKGSSTGQMALTGMSVAAIAAGNALTVGYYANFAAGITSPPMGLGSGTTILLYKAGAGTAAALTDADATDTTRIDFSYVRRVA